LAARKPPVVVLDPVMVAKGGQRLLSDSALDAMLRELMPLVDIVTPNLPEAAALLQTAQARSEQDMQAQGRALLARGARAVLMKGGHLDAAECPDWLITSDAEVRFSGPRIPTKNTHGTGCSLSAALAALRPQSESWTETICDAKDWLSAALAQADRLSIGHGIGPVHHFHKWW
jgi:hydroxymethylpyrimidine/phosphomethylpyrimidine kinase